MFSFSDLIDWPIVSNRLTWQAKLVLRDVQGAPHLFLRVRLTGTFFPERSSEPFLRIGPLRSRMVHIASDGLSVDGYFDALPPCAGVVEFGYNGQAYVRAGRPWAEHAVEGLRRSLLPPVVRNLEHFASVLGGGMPPHPPPG